MHRKYQKASTVFRGWGKALEEERNLQDLFPATNQASLQKVPPDPGWWVCWVQRKKLTSRVPVGHLPTQLAWYYKENASGICWSECHRLPHFAAERRRKQHSRIKSLLLYVLWCHLLTKLNCASYKGEPFLEFIKTKKMNWSLEVITSIPPS